MRNGRVFKQYHQCKLSRVVLAPYSVKHELPFRAHVELHITAHMCIANSITLVSAAVSLLRQA